MKRSFSDEDEQRWKLMEAIFREHFTAVHCYIFSKVRQPDVADDLTSMVFLKAFRWLMDWQNRWNSLVIASSRE